MKGWPVWLGVAALGALVWRALANKTQKPELVITSWQEKQLPSGWAQSAKDAGFTGVSKKIVDAAQEWRPDEAARVFAQADAAGLDRMGWGWHNLRTPLESVQEAVNAAEQSKRWGVDTYFVNAEKMWAGVEGQPATPNPPRELSTFVDTFREMAPGVRLYFNGFSWAKTSDGRPLLTPEVLAKFDGFAPMNYGTTAKTIANKYTSRYNRAKSLGIEYAPMHGTGRVSKDGKVWGFANPSKGHPGLLQLVESQPPDMVAFWYGAGSEDMLTGGSASNPSLAAFAQSVRSAPVA